MSIKLTKKVAIINKYFTIEGKINALLEIINSINISEDKCLNDNLKTLNQIKKIES